MLLLFWHASNDVLPHCTTIEKLRFKKRGACGSGFQKKARPEIVFGGFGLEVTINHVVPFREQFQLGAGIRPG